MMATLALNDLMTAHYSNKVLQKIVLYKNHFTNTA